MFAILITGTILGAILYDVLRTPNDYTRTSARTPADILADLVANLPDLAKLPPPGDLNTLPTWITRPDPNIGPGDIRYLRLMSQ